MLIIKLTRFLNNSFVEMQLTYSTENICTEVATLDLSLAQEPTIVEEVSCDSFYWAQTDQFYTLSGLYSDTFTTSANCDSIVTLDLTISGLSIDLGANTISLCDSSTTLDAGPGYGSYLWSTGETTQTIDVDSSGMYSVTVGDSSSVANNHSLSFDGVDDYVDCGGNIDISNQSFTIGL